MRWRNTAKMSALPFGAMPRRAAGRNRPVGRIDDDAHCGKGEPVRGCKPRHYMGFTSTAAAPVVLCNSRFIAGSGERSIDDDRGVVGSAITSRSLLDHAAFVSRMFCDFEDEDATTQSPARRPDASPPAMRRS